MNKKELRIERMKPLGYIFDRNDLLSNFRKIYHFVDRISYKALICDKKNGRLEKLYQDKEKIKSFISEIIVDNCIIEVDLLTRLLGFFKFLEYAIDKMSLYDTHFQLYLDGKIKVPFIMKKLYNSPYYYLELNKINIDRLKKLIKEEDIFSEAQKEIINNLSVFDKRKINTPQSSFLVGFIYGEKYIKGTISLKEVLSELKRPYFKLYMEVGTSVIHNKCEFEGYEEKK